MSSQNRDSSQRPRRAELSQYYREDGLGDGGQKAAEAASPARGAEVAPEAASGDPFDINGAAFDADAFTQRLIKEASLSQLMAQEAEVVRQVGALDSDMQTLVYENYNKFISATDTIRKMRVDFRAMEDEMDQLAEKMQNISDFSTQVADTLQERRRRIGELSGTHALLKKLQFLFELPAKLKECIAEDDLRAGVKYYLRAQRVLDQYQHMPSFAGIKADCDAIMVELQAGLLTRLRDPDGAPEDLSLYVDLLLQLKESPEELCDTYLSTARVKLDASLTALKSQVKIIETGGIVAPDDGNPNDRPSDAFVAPWDILEFVDHSCNTFISDLCLVIASYSDTFLQKQQQLQRNQRDVSPLSPVVDQAMAERKLTVFVEELNGCFFDTLRERLKLEKKLEDASIRVRALDRFHRRIQAMSRLLPTVDFSRTGLDVVLEAAEMQCKLCVEQLGADLQEALVQTRQQLVTRRKLNVDTGDGEPDLKELNTGLLSRINDSVRLQISSLQLFIDPELTFAVKTYFRSKFSRYYVREGVLVAFFAKLVDTAQELCCSDTAERVTQPALLLLLSRTCLDLASTGMTRQLMSAVDEQFFIDESAASSLTPAARIDEALAQVSQALLDHYVRSQGDMLSQMLRKSVETRDWLNSVEPRTVRAVMKRIVEETTAIDRQVGKIYEEGARKARSSDSSRRTRPTTAGGGRQQHRSNWSITNSQMDTSLASNIQKMFSEKIEIFSSVESSRVSILTGVVKIALKTLLECVRVKTFSRFGFQQIQVDTHYLSLYLWRFVSDENLITFLLDEIMTSVVHRCADPLPMEQSVVDVICDRV